MPQIYHRNIVERLSYSAEEQTFLKTRKRERCCKIFIGALRSTHVNTTTYLNEDFI